MEELPDELELLVEELELDLELRGVEKVGDLAQFLEFSRLDGIEDCVLALMRIGGIIHCLLLGVSEEFRFRFRFDGLLATFCMSFTFFTFFFTTVSIKSLNSFSASGPRFPDT